MKTEQPDLLAGTTPEERTAAALERLANIAEVAAAVLWNARPDFDWNGNSWGRFPAPDLARENAELKARVEALESGLEGIARTDDSGTVTHRLECRQRLARTLLKGEA